MSKKSSIKRKPAVLEAPTKTLKTSSTNVMLFDDGKMRIEAYVAPKVKKQPKKPILGTLIAVSAIDIELATGHLAESWHCPIALALKRTFGVDEVSVSPRLVNIDGKSYRLPYNARTFVNHFDTRQPVSPFVFKLERL